MDELLDILNSNGQKTGKTALKSTAHKEGLYHATVHVWVYTSDRKVLLQQRGFNKETYPGYWDVSVAGHIHAGESIEKAAIREVKEEIGLNITIDQLEKITVKKGERIHANGIVDREFYHIFLLKLTVPFSFLKKQNEEVESIALFDFQILKSTKPSINLVPNPTEHYDFIYNNLLASV